MQTRRLIWTGCFSLCLLFTAMAGRIQARTKPKENKAIKSRNDIVFDLLIKAQRVHQSRDIKTNDFDTAKTYELLNSIPDLLELLDHDDDPSTLALIVRLQDFYIGEHPREDLDCIVLKRGKKILPLLKAKFESGKRDCVQKLDEKDTICLPDDIYQLLTKNLIKSLKNGSTCGSYE